MRILYFCRLRNPRLFNLIEFYSEDLRVFEELGIEVRTESLRRPAAFADADLLYAWWGATAFPVVLAWRLRRRPTILTGAIGEGEGGGRQLRRLARLGLLVIASRAAHKTLAISKLELAELQRLGVRRSSLAYLSVDVDYFRPLSKTSSPTAATVGQVNVNSVHRKGIEIAIAATALIREHVDDYELSVAGPISADGEKWLHRARRRYDFTGVRVLGEVTRERKRSLLQSAWVYLQPSDYEAFGVATLEAMACGTPPVYCTGGALPEIVAGAGVLLPARTPECLAANVVSILGDLERRRELGRAARERALQFGREARREVLAATVAEVMGRR